ncbi:Phage Mu protein F like protein [compost metagenome]
MRSDEYWQKRMEALNEAELKKGDAYIQKQKSEYEKSLARIRKETDAWYARLAKNNGVSMAEARKLLSANELKEFHWDVDEYIKRGRENGIDQRWMKQLENASAKVHITRLEEIKLRTQQELEMLGARRLRGTTEVLGNIYTDGYYRGIHEVQRGIGQGLPFAKIDARQLDKVLAKPWAPDGRNFSARIWADRDKLITELHTSLTQDVLQGGNLDKVISEFAHKMGVSEKVAERLIRTEAAFFSGQSRLDGYKETGVKQYKYVAVMDDRTSDECDDMDGKIFPISEAQAGVNYPPLHAYCRSTTIPVPGKTESEDEAVYDVPEDLTYEDWLKQHAPKDAAEPPVVDKPVPVTPPNVKTEPLSSGRRNDDKQPNNYAAEPDKWYDVTGKSAPKVYPVEELPLDELEPDKPRKLGDIDLEDTKAISEYIDAAEQVISKMPDEHAVVASRSGEIFHVRGDTTTVNPALIGKKKLQGATVTHNHPDYIGEAGGSFSSDDISFFFMYALAELRVVDSEYQYTMKTNSKIDLSIEEVTALVLKAEGRAEMSLTIEEAIKGYDLKHLTMLQLVTLITGLLYERNGQSAHNQ